MTNKFKYILTVLFLFVTTGLFAQQGWQWGHRVENETFGAATDSHGNTYIGWVVDGSVPGIPYVYPLEGGHNISNDSGQCVLTSYTCNGTYRWSKVFGVPGGGGACIVTAYGADSLGGIYVFGSMASSNGNLIFHIGDTTMPTTYGAAFIAKFDTSGHYKWIRVQNDTFSPMAQNRVGILSADILPNGNSYLVIILPSGIYGNGAFTATYPEGNNLYTLKYDKNGNCLGGTHLDIRYTTMAGLGVIGFHMAPSLGALYIAGDLQPNAYADTLRLGDSVLTNGGGQTGPNPHCVTYIARFDAFGNLTWITKENYNSFVSPDFSGSPTVTVDSSGNIYAAGSVPNGTSFGPFTFHNNLAGASMPSLFKLSPDGVILNAISAQSDITSAVSAINYVNGVIGVSALCSTLNWENESLAGSYNWENLSLARFNAANLNIIGLDAIHATLGGSFLPIPSVLSTDSKGDFYMGGSFPAALYLPHDTLYNQSPNTDGYIAKFGFANCNCNPPVSNFTHGNPVVNTAVSFTYSGATPVDSVVWDFGDGTSATGTNVSHSYTQSSDYTVCAVAYNSCGSNMHCEDVNVTPTGIREIPGFAQVSVYPNPATQTLIITNAPAGTELAIYNTIGIRVLHTFLKGNSDQLNVGSLTPGVYLMQFTDKTGRNGMTKFVKE